MWDILMPCWRKEGLALEPNLGDMVIFARKDLGDMVILNFLVIHDTRRKIRRHGEIKRNIGKILILLELWWWYGNIAGTLHIIIIFWYRQKFWWYRDIGRKFWWYIDIKTPPGGPSRGWLLGIRTPSLKKWVALVLYICTLLAKSLYCAVRCSI